MWPNPQEIADLVTFSDKALMENFHFWAVGKRVKLTNSILLIRSCNDSQYLVLKFYSLSSENNHGQGLRSRKFCGSGTRNEERVFSRNSWPAVVLEYFFKL